MPDEDDKTPELRRWEEVSNERQNLLKHFHYVSDQRIKVFGFYMILLAASIGWTVNVFDNDYAIYARVLLALWHVFLGATFYLLDLRSRVLVRTTRQELIKLEIQDDRLSALFTREELENREKNYESTGLKRLLHLGASFRVVLPAYFFLQIFLGIIFFFLAWVLPNGTNPVADRSGNNESHYQKNSSYEVHFHTE